MASGLSGQINRVTLMKVKNPEDIPAILDAYKTMTSTAKKDGKPYILSLKSGEAAEDQRTQGWNLVAISQFGSIEDMRYYDDDCEAHKHLKSVARPLVEGVMTVYFGDRT